MPDVTRGQAFTVQIQHDQVDTDSYELSVNGGVKATKPVDPAGVNFTFPDGLPAGSYELVVTAVGAGGRSASEPVTLIVATGAPAQPRIVIVVG